MRIFTHTDFRRLLLTAFIGLLVGSSGISLAQQRSPNRAQWVRVSSVEVPTPISTTGVTQFGLRRADLGRLRSIPTVQAVVPVRNMDGSVSYAGKSTDVSLIGTTSEYTDVAIARVVSGRFLTKADNRSRQNVCVISESVARSLFVAASPLGRHIRYGSNVFTVVGVVRPQRASSDADEPSSLVYIPINTMQSRLGDLLIIRSEGSLTSERYELSDVWMRFESYDDKKRGSGIVRSMIQRQYPDKDVIMETDPFAIIGRSGSTERPAR